MKQSHLNDYLQLAALLGVIVGLVLVIYEIRENNRIAENQAAIEMNGLYNEWAQAMMDEDISALWIRSLESPESLNRQELLRLRGAYFTALQVLRAGHFLWQSGGLRMYREDALAIDTKNIFSSPVGRQFLLNYLEGQNEQFAIIMRDAVLGSSPDTFLEVLDKMQPDVADEGRVE